MDKQDYKPLLAVEFDGDWHEIDPRQPARDVLKDGLCERFHLPLLRVNSSYLKPLDRRMDMVTWIVDVWFMQRAYLDAQDSGSIPWDEPFMPSMFLDPSAPPDDRFRWFLSADAREEIRRLFLAKKCAQYVPCAAIGKDEAHNFFAIAFLLLTKDSGVICEAKMRRQNFYVPFDELLEDIAVLQLYERVQAALAGGQTISWLEIERRCLAFRQKFHVFSAGGTLPNPLMSDYNPPMK